MQVTSFPRYSLCPCSPCTGFVRVTASQRWNDRLKSAGDFINVGINLVGPLKKPVAGLLGASYDKSLP